MTRRANGTGNYAFPELPVGKYLVLISKAGFRPYASKEVSLSATQTVRFDDALEEEKNVKEGEEEEESGEEYYIDLMSRVDGSQWAHIVSGDTLKNLPVLGFSNGEGRLRNPLNSLWLTPGSLMIGQQYFGVSGAPGDTGSVRVEGQDANNGLMRNRTMATQPGVDAIEEFSIQAGNYPGIVEKNSNLFGVKWTNTDLAAVNDMTLKLPQINLYLGESVLLFGMMCGAVGTWKEGAWGGYG